MSVLARDLSASNVTQLSRFQAGTTILVMEDSVTTSVVLMATKLMQEIRTPTHMLRQRHHLRQQKNPVAGSQLLRVETIAPAICLYVVAGLSMINHLAAIPMALSGNNPNPFLPPNAAGPDQTAQMVGTVIGTIVGFLFDLTVIIGAYNMHKLKSHGAAMAGAIVACIPCCGPCVLLGIPFGIWSLVVLNDKDVKSAFG